MVLVYAYIYSLLSNHNYYYLRDLFENEKSFFKDLILYVSQGQSAEIGHLLVGLTDDDLKYLPDLSNFYWHYTRHLGYYDFLEFIGFQIFQGSIAETRHYSDILDYLYTHMPHGYERYFQRGFCVGEKYRDKPNLYCPREEAWIDRHIQDDPDLPSFFRIISYLIPHFRYYGLRMFLETYNDFDLFDQLPLVNDKILHEGTVYNLQNEWNLLNTFKDFITKEQYPKHYKKLETILQSIQDRIHELERKWLYYQVYG